MLHSLLISACSVDKNKVNIILWHFIGNMYLWPLDGLLNLRQVLENHNILNYLPSLYDKEDYTFGFPIDFS